MFHTEHLQSGVFSHIIPHEHKWGVDVLPYSLVKGKNALGKSLSLELLLTHVFKIISRSQIVTEPKPCIVFESCLLKRQIGANNSSTEHVPFLGNYKSFMVQYI